MYLKALPLRKEPFTKITGAKKERVFGWKVDYLLLLFR